MNSNDQLATGIEEMLASARFADDPFWRSVSGRWFRKVALSLLSNHADKISSSEEVFLINVALFNEQPEATRKRIRAIADRFPIGTIWFEHCPSRNPYISKGEKITTKADIKEAKALAETEARLSAEISAQLEATGEEAIKQAKAEGAAAFEAGLNRRDNPNHIDVIKNAAWETGWRSAKRKAFETKQRKDQSDANS